MSWACRILISAVCLLPVASALAQPANASAGAATEPVYTRGEFRGSFAQGREKLYARLKFAPGLKLPFSTLSFRVRDAGLLTGFAPGALVEFRAERIEGENTLTALRAVQP